MKGSPKLTVIRQISPRKLTKSGSEQINIKLEANFSKPPLSKRKKEKRQRVDVNDVLSSPRDNEADHNDRPTSEEVNSPEPVPPQDANKEVFSAAREGREVAHMLNAYIEENPTIDLFIKDFEQLEHRRSEPKKLVGGPRKKSGRKKRSGSAKEGSTTKRDFRQTFARKQILKHLNRERGINETIERVVGPLEQSLTNSEDVPDLIDIQGHRNSDPPPQNLKKSKSMAKEVYIRRQPGSSHNAVLFQRLQQKQVRDVIGSRGSSKRRKNWDLMEEPGLLPKVQSTVMSNPKFVGKSRLILGVNKYIGGTYRNTTLAQ